MNHSFLLLSPDDQKQAYLLAAIKSNLGQFTFSFLQAEWPNLHAEAACINTCDTKLIYIKDNYPCAHP